jgi:hypothetical protein
MPNPGWYDDPEQPYTWRYWDGAHWTDHRAPMWVPPDRDPMSFSVWFERAVAVGKVAVRRVGALLAAVWLLLGVLGWWLVVATYDSARGRELRRLLLFEDDPISPTGTSLRDDLTDAEADRAWELFQDIFWSALPWLIALAVAFVVVSAWSVALVARAVQPTLVEGIGREEQVDGLGTLVVGALRRAPAVVGSGIVVLAVFFLVAAVAALPVVLVAVADAGGAAIVLTAVFAVLLALAVSAWLWVRLTLASVIAAAGGHGIGVRRSWNVTSGRFWFVAGRLLVTGLIAGAAGGVVNFVTGFGQFLGLAVFLAIVSVLQALTVAVSMIVTTCGHLATIEQLGEQLGEPVFAGSSDGDHAA